MGERADEIKDAASEESSDPQEIRENIEQTRAAMSETIDAIQEKVDPERVKAKVVAQAQQKVETVKQAVTDLPARKGPIYEFVRRNPIPVAIGALILVAIVVRKITARDDSEYVREVYVVEN